MNRKSLVSSLLTTPRAGLHPGSVRFQAEGPEDQGGRGDPKLHLRRSGSDELSRKPPAMPCCRPWAEADSSSRVNTATGLLFEKGKPTGTVKMTAISVGAQVGGGTSPEIIFFETADALKSLQAVQVRNERGRQGLGRCFRGFHNAKYDQGVAVFTLPSRAPGWGRHRRTEVQLQADQVIGLEHRARPPHSFVGAASPLPLHLPILRFGAAPPSPPWGGAVPSAREAPIHRWRGVCPVGPQSSSSPATSARTPPESERAWGGPALHDVPEDPAEGQAIHRVPVGESILSDIALPHAAGEFFETLTRGGAPRRTAGRDATGTRQTSGPLPVKLRQGLESENQLHRAKH